LGTILKRQELLHGVVTCRPAELEFLADFVPARLGRRFKALAWVSVGRWQDLEIVHAWYFGRT